MPRERDCQCSLSVPPRVISCVVLCVHLLPPVSIPIPTPIPVPIPSLSVPPVSVSVSSVVEIPHRHCKRRVEDRRREAPVREGVVRLHRHRERDVWVPVVHNQRRVATHTARQVPVHCVQSPIIDDRQSVSVRGLWVVPRHMRLPRRRHSRLTVTMTPHLSSP